MHVSGRRKTPFHTCQRYALALADSTLICTNSHTRTHKTSRHCTAWRRVMPFSCLSVAKSPVQRSSDRHVRMRVDSVSRRALGRTTACCAFESVLSEYLYAFVCCFWIFEYSQTATCALLIL